MITANQVLNHHMSHTHSYHIQCIEKEIIEHANNGRYWLTYKGITGLDGLGFNGKPPKFVEQIINTLEKSGYSVELKMNSSIVDSIKIFWKK